MAKLHVVISDETYGKLWQLIKKRYPIPHKKLHVEVNKALEEYLSRQPELAGEKPVGKAKHRRGR